MDESKDMIKRMRRQPIKQERIFVNYVSKRD